MRIEMSKVAMLTALVGLASACGNGGATVNSGLPKEKAANELTADESDAFCDAYIDTVNAEFANIDTCVATAYTATALEYFLNGGELEDLRALCSDSYDECQDSETSGTIVLSECMTTTEPQASCEATVGELEACLGDEIDQRVRSFDVPSCGEVTIEGLEEYVDSAGEESEDPERTPACQTVDAACPDGF